MSIYSRCHRSLGIFDALNDESGAFFSSVTSICALLNPPSVMDNPYLVYRPSCVHYVTPVQAKEPGMIWYSVEFQMVDGSSLPRTEPVDHDCRCRAMYLLLKIVLDIVLEDHQQVR